MQEKYIFNAVSGKKSRPFVYFLFTFGLALAVVQKAAPADPNETFTTQTPITLPGGKTIGSLDISWVDKYARVYLLADRVNASVDMVDLNTNNVTIITPSGASAFQGNVNDPNGLHIGGPNGVATINHAEIWAADSPTFAGGASTIVMSSTPSVAYATDNCDSSIKVISLITQQVTDVIPIGGCFRSDEFAFDEANQVVLVANPDEQNIGKSVTLPFITLISAAPVAPGQHHTILTKINFDGTNGTPNATAGIEQAVWSPDTGLFYLSVPQDGTDPTVGAVAVIDARLAVLGANPVITKFAVKNNCGPAGAALGPNHEMFLGCSNGPTQVIDIRDGSVQATIQQVAGCDEVYATGDNHFVGACTDAQGNGAVGIVDSDYLTFDQILSGISHSIAADPVSGKIFAPVEMNSTPSLCPAASQATGCIAVISAAVTQASVTPLTATTSNTSITLDASASTSASGSLTYQFSVVAGSLQPSILQSPTSPQATVQFISGAGTYKIQVTVTDANGTTSTSPVITLIYQPSGGGSTGGGSAPVTVSVTGPAGSTGSTTPANTFNTTTGQITLNATGSTSTNAGALTFALAPVPGTGSASASIQQSTPGTFSIQLPARGMYQLTLTVTDATGVSNTATITLNYI